MSTSLNEPYQPPPLHFVLDDRFRATNEQVNGRLPSGAYLPVPLADRDATPQGADSLDVHARINRIRELIQPWRDGGYPGIHRSSRELLEFWRSDAPEPRPFFAQWEALETLIWLSEAAANDTSGQPILAELREINDGLNHGIPRLAVKMATGTGKTRVMAMIILWQALLSPDPLHVLVVAPNLTVLDRLGVLDPRHDTELYRSLLPPNRRLPVGRMQVTVRNFQAFQQRDRLAVDGPGDRATGAARKLLRPAGQDPRWQDPRWQESRQEMIDRVLGEHRGARRILVLNDEAHHCYPAFPRPRRTDSETKRHEQQAALWFGAIETLHRQQRLGPVYDLSATPMYLQAPPNRSYPLFPWVVSDYPLIEAVEAGITKVPRVPVRDNTVAGQPVYRNLFNQLPKACQKLDPRQMPALVDEALDILHQEYQKAAQRYAEVGIKPVLIIVANTTANADAFYRYVAGEPAARGAPPRPGRYPVFSNVDRNGRVVKHPPTLLIHSGLEDAASEADTKANRLAAEQKLFFPAGEKATAAEQAAHIREVFNTVGQAGKPGENVRCLISVSMLTEGWDVRNVTHILGFRAFKSQLLCEQVAGRALRRTSIPRLSPGERLTHEYADILGIPFAFMRDGEPAPAPPPPPQPWPVCSRREQAGYRITWPNIVGYRWELPAHACRLDPDRVQPFEPAAPILPTATTLSGSHGEEQTARREQERANSILYGLARLAVEKFRSARPEQPLPHRSLFTDILRATRAWLEHPAVRVEGLDLLATAPNQETAALAIAGACVTEAGDPILRPIFADEEDPTAARCLDTEGIEFSTTLRLRYPATNHAECRRSELNAAACHSAPEVSLARELDRHPGIAAWARNFRLGWSIPWYHRQSGSWRRYEPDFVARTQHAEPRLLVIEFKGPVDDHADAKRTAIEESWLPAVNGSPDPACQGRWRYLHLTDEARIRAELDRAIRDASG